MSLEEFIRLIEDIVKESCRLKDAFTAEKEASVNYACIFCQKQKEYKSFLSLAGQLGKIIKETPSGPIFHTRELATVSGKLRLLKIRKPDKNRPERGDADFTIADYPKFKKEVLVKPEFKLIKREAFEMIELIDPNFDIRTYFSNPPLTTQFRLTA